MTYSNSPGAERDPGAPLKGRWFAMASLLVASFMNLIDITIVNVAVPSLQAAFDATDSQIEWVVASYVLAFALVLIPAGRLGDVIGRRRMFLAGVAVFTLGSALCGAAPTMPTLIAARVVQGFGGAMIAPQTLALVPVLFQPRERGAAFGLFGLFAGLASVTGPVLGGFLIEWDVMGLGWRPIFLVNIPFGVIAILAALRFVPDVPGDKALSLDLVGVAIAGTALMLVLFPLIEGRQFGWPLWCFALMAAALPVFVLFGYWQRRQAARGAPQLIPVNLRANRNYVIGTALTVLLFCGIPGFFLVLALLLQLGNGLSALESGLTTVAFSVGTLATSVASGVLGLWKPRLRISIAGSAVVIGMVLLRGALPEAGEALDRGALFGPLLIAGLGLGACFSPMFQTVLSNVDPRDGGAASGTLQALQQVGGALGIAVMGEIFFSSLRRGLASAADPVAAYTAAFNNAAVFATAAFALVATLVWLLPRPQGAPPR